MAEIDTLEEALESLGPMAANDCVLDAELDTPAYNARIKAIFAAAEAHLASLRAPKGELEEARAMADMREWLGEEGSLRSASFSPISVKLKDYRTNDEWTIVGRNDHTALTAALSRARGEGT